MGNRVSIRDVSNDTILAMRSAQSLRCGLAANEATAGHLRNPYAARSLAECGP